MLNHVINFAAVFIISFALMLMTLFVIGWVRAWWAGEFEDKDEGGDI